MTTLNPSREEVLFALVLEKPADSRPAFLDAMCEEDTALRQRLPAGHPMTVESMENLATCYEQSNRKPEAESLRRELVELKAKAGDKKPAKP